MAKELPYFQFEPAEYLTKNISFCSLSAQGLFINICSYYWQRECKLTKEQVLKRLNYTDELEELITEGIIDVKDDFIIIKFLDNQLNNVKNKSESKSQKGLIGNLKRWHKDIYKMYDNQEITLDEAIEMMNNNIATQSPPDSHPIAKLSLPDKKSVANQSLEVADKIREDKIKEDKIKEDKNINSHSPINWESFLKFYNDTFGKKVRGINDVTKKKFLKLLKDGYTKEDILKAMVTVKNDEFAKSKKYGYCIPLYFTRPDVIDRYAFPSEIKNKNNTYNGTL